MVIELNNVNDRELSQECSVQLRKTKATRVDPEPRVVMRGTHGWNL